MSDVGADVAMSVPNGWHVDEYHCVRLTSPYGQHTFWHQGTTRQEAMQLAITEALAMPRPTYRRPQDAQDDLANAHITLEDLFGP